MTINIAKLLSADEWDKVFCKVSIPCTFQNGRIEDFIPKEVKIINISWSSQVALLKQFSKVIRMTKPDVVFSSVMPYNQRLMLLKPFFKNTRFIIRNDNYLYTLPKYKQFILKLTYRQATDVIAQTEEMKNELQDIGLSKDRVVVLHNLIDEELISKKASEDSPFRKDNKIRFVSVGRFAPQKGFDILIKAFKAVSSRIKESELYIIGDYTSDGGSVYSNLKSLAEELEINDRVVFTGYTDNPYRYIKNADVYVLSSRYEGLPNVLIEAQFLRTPSAAAKCIPMISRMIKDGENGFLAESENPESLAFAMINAVNIKEVKEVYKPSSKDDYIKLFNN